MQTMTRRSFVRTTGAASAAVALPVSATLRSNAASARRLADVGWCWDGQGFCGGTPTSIFGAGEGTRWFGLKKTCFMFHPNTELAMEKLRGFEEVLCEISKWRERRCSVGGCGVEHYLDGTIESKRSEAENVNLLARTHRNIKGTIDDDLLGIIKREKITPDQYARVYEALRKGRPDLKLWIVVYARELVKADWAGFQPFADVINLCVSAQVENFSNLYKYLDQCGEIFPGKPVNLIYRLTDFGRLGPVPVDQVKEHWTAIARAIDQGRLSGYSILGGLLIDSCPDQARAIRDFIAAH